MRDPLLCGSAFRWHANEYSDEVEREWGERESFFDLQRQSLPLESSVCRRGCLSLQAASEFELISNHFFSFPITVVAPRIVLLSVHARAIRLFSEHTTSENKNYLSKLNARTEIHDYGMKPRMWRQEHVQCKCLHFPHVKWTALRLPHICDPRLKLPVFTFAQSSG